MKVEGREIVLPTPALEVKPTRYLGIYLGGPQAVLRDWQTRISGSLTERLLDVLRAGIPRSCYGKAMEQDA